MPQAKWKNRPKSATLLDKMPRKIEISYKTVVFIVFFLIFLRFLFFIKDILLEFFVALLVMTILNPAVTKLSKLRIPKVVSVLLVYFLLIGVIGGSIALIVPALIDQTTSFATSLPKYFSNLGLGSFYTDELAKEFFAQIGSLPGQILKIGGSILSNFLGVLTVLFFAFYLLMARDKLEEQLGVFFGDEKQKELGRIIDTLERRLGGWARGELTLMLLVGVANYIGLSLLGIPFALPLAILAGSLEIIPYIGPIIAAVPAVVIGFGISPVMGVAALALAFIVQQTENYVFVPKIMEKSVGVSPIITLLGLAIGLRLAGVVGVLISVPAIITLQVLVSEYFLSSKEETHP